MKLLLDQGLPRGAVELLNAQNFEAVHVGDIGMAGAEDQAILEFARLDERVVVTLDADFHALLARSGASEPSVIRIRIEGLKAQSLTQIIQTVREYCHLELEQGAVATVQEDCIRVRRLPLIFIPED